MEKADMVKQLRELVAEFNKITGALCRDGVEINADIDEIDHICFGGPVHRITTLSIDPMERIK